VEQVIAEKFYRRIDWRQFLRDYYDLSKPGIGFYSLITTFAAFWLASGPTVDWILLIHTILATALVTCGGGALNQVLEVVPDSQMRRTENRPLPAGRVPVSSALLFGVVTSIIGVAYLQLQVNTLSSILAIATLIGYLFVYTPLKRITHLSTIVGAFPGATPILIGWVAVRNSIDFGGWVLFAILFVWQIPHFLAIAWMYRKDYARAGFPMLSVLDEEGSRVAHQIMIYVLALLPISLLPTLLGLTGIWYFAGATLCGIGFAVSGVRSAIRRTNRSAKELLFASIIYLPVVLLLMVLDKA
jgi:heme o synthase